MAITQLIWEPQDDWEFARDHVKLAIKHVQQGSFRPHAFMASEANDVDEQLCLVLAELDRIIDWQTNPL